MILYDIYALHIQTVEKTKSLCGIIIRHGRFLFHFSHFEIFSIDIQVDAVDLHIDFVFLYLHILYAYSELTKLQLKKNNRINNCGFCAWQSQINVTNVLSCRLCILFVGFVFMLRTNSKIKLFDWLQNIFFLPSPSFLWFMTRKQKSSKFEKLLKFWKIKVIWIGNFLFVCLHFL